jgi:hypothetical protein
MRSNFKLLRTLVAASMIVAVAGLVGCQTTQAPPSRLINHRAMIDFSGLKPVVTFAPVDMQGSVPQSWEATKLKKTAGSDWVGKRRVLNVECGLLNVDCGVLIVEKVEDWLPQSTFNSPHSTFNFHPPTTKSLRSRLK